MALVSAIRTVLFRCAPQLDDGFYWHCLRSLHYRNIVADLPVFCVRYKSQATFNDWVQTDMKHFVAIENRDNDCIGPFDTIGDAAEWADKNIVATGWKLKKLKTPDEQAKSGQIN